MHKCNYKYGMQLYWSKELVLRSTHLLANTTTKD